MASQRVDSVKANVAADLAHGPLVSLLELVFFRCGS
jgi:hypothetical protein